MQVELRRSNELEGNSEVACRWRGNKNLGKYKGQTDAQKIIKKGQHRGTG